MAVSPVNQGISLAMLYQVLVCRSQKWKPMVAQVNLSYLSGHA